MAGEASNLLSEAVQAAKDWTRTRITGKYPDGSIEDLESQLKLAQTEQALRAAKQDPNDPRKRQLALQRFKDFQDLELRGQQATMDLVGRQLPLLVDTKGQLSDIETRQTTSIENAKTDNDLRLIGAKSGILDRLTGHEARLAEMDIGTRDAFIGYLEREGDKNRAAQAAARKPNFSNVASLLTGLGATAAALFA